jgi:hypothetical protein
VTRRAVVTVVLIAALTAALATPAQAATTRRLCAKVAQLRDSPEGFVIGRLYRPQRLRLVRRNPSRRWALVVTRSGVAGWIPSRSLCRA